MAIGDSTYSYEIAYVFQNVLHDVFCNGNSEMSLLFNHEFVYVDSNIRS